MTDEVRRRTSHRSSVDPRRRWGSTDCERLRDGPIAQPVNTVTSLAFVAAGGAVALGHGVRRPEAAAFAAMLVLVGAGSVAFHGPQPRGSKAMHDWPIAGVVGMAVATPLVRRLRDRTALPGWSRPRAAAAGAIGASAVAAYAAGRTSAPTCDPDSPLQFHGLWHVLSAAGFVLVADLMYGSRPERHRASR